MRVTVLGVGTWGYALARLLASKGYKVTAWARRHELINEIQKLGKHPKLPEGRLNGELHFTTDLKEALRGSHFIVESVTTNGLRSTLSQIRELRHPPCPLVITSKGIERGTGSILPAIALETLGEEWHNCIGALSGPSYAEEVIQGLPTSVVTTSYGPHTMMTLGEVFSTHTFRVYPNGDLLGVALGGSLKNCIAIACGISDGLGLGTSCKSAVMTRGLHEICKLGVAMGCKATTFYGLAGMGDVFLTCSSTMSRNYRFGLLLAKGISSDEAQASIGMVVEGANTCFAGLLLGTRYNVPMPIIETVTEVLQGKKKPMESVTTLMQRPRKEEHL